MIFFVISYLTGYFRIFMSVEMTESLENPPTAQMYSAYFHVLKQKPQINLLKLYNV